MAENALVRLFGREAATRRRNELAANFAPDPTPVRNRIAEHRQQVDATLGGTTLQNRLAMIGGSGVPVLSDVAGLAADAMGYAGDPSSRTPVNYGLSALGLLPFLPGMTAYHGTPHRFAPEPDAPLGKFKMEKLGTGEGAQAYGHGMYFAESPDVARGYQARIAGGAWVDKRGIKKTTNQIAQDIVDQARKDGLGVLEADEAAGFWSVVARDGDKASGSPGYASIKKVLDEQGIRFQQEGNLYHVDIPDEQIDQMLDWDKPLSEQPHIMEAFGIKARDPGAEQAVMEKARALGVDPRTLPEYQALEKAMDESRQYRDMTGADFYKQLTADKRDWAIAAGKNDLTSLQAIQRLASDDLAALGIPGIRYFDGGSRGAGQGTRNFVVFQPEKLKVLKRE